MGFSTFKLLERNIPSYALLERARAYHQRRYEGNLADLLLSWGFRQAPPGFTRRHLFRAFRFWKMPLGLAGTAREFMKTQGMLLYTQANNPVHIDSQAIPADFLDHFEHGSCLDRSCRDCGYCARLAHQAVSIEPEFLAQVLPLYQEMESRLVSGTF
jgi:hypothetical protein